MQTSLRVLIICQLAGVSKPSLEVGYAISKALGVSLDVLCGLNNSEPSKLELLAKKAASLPQEDINALELVLGRFVEG